MIDNATDRKPPGVQLPFGKHKGRPLDAVPSEYLDWLLRETKLSAGLRLAVGNELRRRNRQPPEPPPRPVRPCPRCGHASFRLTWVTFRNGEPHIGAACRNCGSSCGWAEQTPGHVREANGESGGGK